MSRGRRTHTVRAAGIALLFLFLPGAVLLAQEEDPDVYDRQPRALGAQNTVLSQAEFMSGGLYYHRWAERIGYLLTAGIFYDPIVADGGGASGQPLFSYVLRGDLMRRVFSGDVADWLSGALFVYGRLSQGGRITVDAEYVEPTDEQLENNEIPPPEVTVNPFVPYVGASLGVGFETVFISHYSLFFSLGYGPVVDLQPFALQSFGLGVTTGLAIRF
mgnify:CR=1 FL=1